MLLVELYTKVVLVPSTIGDTAKIVYQHISSGDRKTASNVLKPNILRLSNKYEFKNKISGTFRLFPLKMKPGYMGIEVGHNKSFDERDRTAYIQLLSELGFKDIIYDHLNSSVKNDYSVFTFTF